MENKISDPHHHSALLFVLLFGGLVGFCLGLSNATWQVTVETGQVLAGIVRYPPENPFYMYHIKAFTIINHISALLLSLGISERAVSFLISGLLGMISFQAIATLIFAINRNVLMAVLGVIFIYFTNYLGDGVVYTIWLLGQPHTYGILGLSFAVLVIALLAAKAYKPGLFCLGLLPCVHPSIGIWLVLVVFLSALLRFDFTKKIIKAYYLYLIAGITIALLSLTYQIYLMRGLPTIDLGMQKQILDSYVKYWDSHRRPFYWPPVPTQTSFKNWGVVYCIYSIIVGFLSLKFFKKDDALSFLSRVMIIAGISSLSLGFISQLPPENIPSYLLIFMPGRYVNLSNVIFPASILGILTCNKNRKYVTNYNIFVLFLVCSFFSRHDEVQVVVFFIILLWLTYLYCTSTQETKLLSTRKHRISYKILLAIFVVIFLAINIPREKFVRRYFVKAEYLKDWTNNEFLNKVFERDGLLLVTHHSSLISLKTRRPILVDMASPNFFTVAPESALIFNDILTKVYGVDLRTPPPKEYQHREIRPELYKDLWENRTIKEWQEIRKEFEVTDILTMLDWELSLPIIAKSKRGILYNIPVQCK